jgi:hypothetical protein
MQAIFLTSQRLITEHWPAVARLLERLGTEHGEFTVDDLLELCRDGRAVAGIAFDEAGAPLLAMVWELRLYPRRTAVNVIALAGRDLAAVASTFWPHWLSWCRECGISDIQACTRPAMSRMLRRLGFRHTYNVLRMPTGAAT